MILLSRERPSEVICQPTYRKDVQKTHGEAYTIQSILR